MINATANNLGEMLDKDIAIVDFWAPWCGPCLNLAPLIEEVSKETKVPLFKVNIEENQDLAEKYGIMSIPSVLIFKKGIVSTSITGTRPKNVYIESLK